MWSGMHSLVKRLTIAQLLYDYESLTSVTLEGQVEWLTTGSITPNQLATV